MAGRPRLNDEKQRELVRRYELGRRNRPKQICRDLGISLSVFYNYLRRARS